MQQAHDREIADLKGLGQGLQSEIDQLKALVAHLQEVVRDLESKVLVRDQEIEGMKEQVVEAHIKMEKSVQEHLLRTREVEHQYKEKELKLQNSLRKTME